MGQTRPTLDEGQFFVSKLPESMDKIFIYDGTTKGGIPCVKYPDGTWGRGEVSDVGEAGKSGVL